MTEGYRQKLLNWFCSMSILLATAALSALLVWFVHVPRILGYGPPRDLVTIAGPFGESLVAYPIYFLPVAVWHLLDFLQARELHGTWGKRFTRYRNFAACTALSQLSFLLAVWGILNVTSCPEGEFYFYQCTVGPPWWLWLIFTASSLLALALCIGKGIIAIRSLFQKAQ